MYGKNWNSFYINTYLKGNKQALWDVPVERAIANDYALFSETLDPQLPIIDIGCGTGRQTQYLSQHFPFVLGTDVSSEAIKIAQEISIPGRLAFEVLDGTDTDAAKRIADKIGPANVYLRGVMHQILDDDLQNFQESLLLLLGGKGHLFSIEVGDKIREHFTQPDKRFSDLPTRLKQVFISNLPPKGLSLENLSTFFPEALFKVLDVGESYLGTNLKYPDGEAIKIPAIYCLAAPQ